MNLFSRLYKLDFLSILKTNSHYCYAWEIGRAFSYVLKYVVTKDFYEDLREVGTQLLKSVAYTEGQKQGFIEIMQSPFKNSIA